MGFRSGGARPLATPVAGWQFPAMTSPAGMALPEHTAADLAAMTPAALVALLIRDEDRVPRAVVDVWAVAPD
jgi:hypothetical protein